MTKHTKLTKAQMRKAIEMLVLAVKVIKPDMTDEEAKNIIVNVGNAIHLESMGKL